MHITINKIIALVTILSSLLFLGLVNIGYAQTSPEGKRVVVDSPGTELWEAVRRDTLPINSQVEAGS